MLKIHFKGRDLLLTFLILLAAYCAGLVLQRVLYIEEHITTVFVFAVFLISLLTDGYRWGVISAFTGTLAVNFFFTEPYYTINFLIQANFLSAAILTSVSLLTSTLTVQNKRHEATRAEAEMERMRANLLRAVSHDLRTPLTSIYGSTSAILDAEGTLTQAQQTKMLRSIQEDAQWLIRMVENLLSITRIDAVGVTIIKTPTVLDELLDAVLHKFHARYPRQSVKLDIPDEIVMIPMDPMLIEQVLINLLENAVQHGEGMRNLWLQVTVKDGFATFEIADDGCGIRPERLENLFNGFFESHTTPADGQKRNTGIGLSVCATIIRAHGGTIHAENAALGGAVFRFTLNTEDFTDEQ